MQASYRSTSLVQLFLLLTVLADDHARAGLGRLAAQAFDCRTSDLRSFAPARLCFKRSSLVHCILHLFADHSWEVLDELRTPSFSAAARVASDADGSW